MYWVSSNGKTGPMYRTPSGFEFQNVYNSAKVDREGMKPLTPHTSPGLRELSFRQVIAQTDYRASVEAIVRELTYVAAIGQRIRFSGGSDAFENGRWWVIQSLNVKVTRRTTRNSASFVTLDWKLHEYVGSAKTIAVKKKKAPPKKKKSKATRTHTVRKGESLFSIAKKYLGSGYKWKTIHALNKKILPNPNRLKVGMRLKIPGK